MRSKINAFLKRSCQMAGKPITFILALSIVIAWFIVGLFVGFSPTWLLIIDTIATVNASLMVFIIQNTQNRESKALHMKIDELLHSIKEAKNELIAIEEIEEEELEELRKQLKQRRKEKEKKP
ncbi:MAG: low affinity iron permease family protein [Parachlamydia sp.]|nr:low affinity iron permease family protein [Parachlamydia sp.]